MKISQIENSLFLQVRQLVLFYLYSFLIIDLLNGYLLNVMMIDFPLTIGQAIRGIFTIIFIIELIAKRKINYHNQYIFYLIAVAPFMVALYFFRDGSVGVLPMEIVAFVKPLFFLLLMNQIIVHYDFFKEKVEKILLTNLIIFSFAIVVGYLSGVGVNAYSIYYMASKSFFYASNSTAILGFTLTIYFTYKIKESLVYIFHVAAAVLALFFSGSMVILIYPFFLFYFLAYKVYDKLLFKILTSFLTFLTVILFLSGALNSLLFIDNSLFFKYQDRALHSINYFDKHSTIEITPLRWYSYVSGARAIRADAGIRNIFNESENLAFGYGSAMRSKKVGMEYAGRTGSEMDFIDIFLDYGVIGFLLVYIPILRVIFPILIKVNTGMNAMVIYFMFLYSSFAGHVVTAPMGGTLFALFLGIEYGRQQLAKEEIIKQPELKPVVIY